MSVPDLIVRGHQVVIPETSSAPNQRPRTQVVGASIHIKDGRIVEIKSFDEVPYNCEVVTADENAVVMPGLVDTHVHINEPGRTDWEGFATATRAAAAGGVTTLIDMPLNSIPPTTTLAGLQQKIDAAREKCQVDVGFWGGVVPGNTSALTHLFEAGVVGFKCFLVPSGVDEFPHVTELDLREAMPKLARLNTVLIVHAELPGPIDEACSAVELDGSTRQYQSFLNTRPRAAENEAVALMIRLSSEIGTRVHIVHHSSADVLSLLREAKSARVKITAETCPHYLVFVSEEIPEGATEFKCCPPIRERENREELWQALSDGTLDMIVSDHSPCPPEMKLRETGDFLNAWGGISSLQLRLPVVWTEARKRGFTLSDLTRWLCAAPAKLVELHDRKGSISVGCDADLVIWMPEERFCVNPELLEHKHRLTPYAGQILQGVVQKTFLRGQKIYDDGRFPSGPIGAMLRRN